MYKPLYIISLSGGGFRAALFHAGVLRAHFDAGIFDEDSRNHNVIINAVSGGAIPAMVWQKFLSGDPEFQESNPTWPEERILELITSGPRFGGQFNWLIKGAFIYAQKAWLSHLENWWQGCGVPVSRFERIGLEQKPGTSQSYPVFIIEMLDFNTGNFWTFYDARIFQINLDFFKYGEIQNSSVSPAFGPVPVPVALAAATAFPAYFPGIKINGTNFVDAGLVDNSALYAFKPLINVRPDSRGLKQGDTWFLSDAGKRMALPSGAVELFEDGRKIVPRLNVFDRIFRLTGDLAQPATSSVFLEAIKCYAEVNIFGVGAGIVAHEEDLWMTTDTLPDENKIGAVATGLFPLKIKDAVCLISHGAQSASSALEAPEKIHKSICSKILGLVN